jgi:hypothetical protein
LVSKTQAGSEKGSSTNVASIGFISEGMRAARALVQIESDRFLGI